MIEKELLKKIFEKNQAGKEYIILNHSDKTWMMPNESLKIALEMYQPSTIKGKVLKSCMKLFHNNESILKKLGAQKKSFLIKPDILLYLQKLTGETDFFVAAYMGDTTSRQNNKITLQIYNDKKILCYTKVSEEPEVLENFLREIYALKSLEEKGIDNIPKVLGDGQLGSMRFFAQSTHKPLKQQVRLEFGQKQIEFIHNIVKRTSSDVKYEASDFYISMQFLKEQITNLNDQMRLVINKAIKLVERYEKEKGFEYAFSHGDYTPWNVYYVDGEINGFDFEYCDKTMPAYIDVFHYLTQLSVLGFHNDMEKTMVLYEEHKKMLAEYMTNPDVIYVCYLLYIISFYYNRTCGSLEQMKESLGIWVGLLEWFNDKPFKST